MAERRWLWDAPLTADDLRNIADELERVEKLLINPDTGEYPEGDLTISVAISRPDSYDTSVFGHFICEDGWMGFNMEVPDAD